MTLDKIRALCDAATPGPWAAGHERHGDPTDEVWSWTHAGVARFAWETDSGQHGYGLSKADAEFCAAARTLLPKLLAIAEAASDLRDGTTFVDGTTLAMALDALETP